MKFTNVPKSQWPRNDPKPPLKVFVNDRFLVQIIQDREFIRMTVNRVNPKSIREGSPIWEDGILWDELQDIKNSIGYEKDWMVEVYPPIDKVTNVANMRHLWLLDECPAYAWNK